MTEKVKINLNINHVKSYEFEDYMITMFLQASHHTGWAEGFYFSLGRPSLLRLDKKSVLISYSDLLYAKGDYSPYITISRNSDGFLVKPVKNINPKSQDPYWIKVDSIEPYELAPVREFVLEKIEEVEKAKKEGQKHQR